MRQLVWCAAVFGLLGVTAWAGSVQIVEDGQAVAEIVIATNANPSVKLAARDLRDCLRQISGAELQTVEEPTADVASQIYVGQSEFTRKLGFTPATFQNSGYQILAKDNYVILSGTDRFSKPFPYEMTHSESQYLHRFAGKPAGYPSPGLKKWQEYCGEAFSLIQINNGADAFNRELNIYVSDDTGTWYAASALLEQLGVRLYAPYENGTVIPKMKNVSIAEQQVKSEAAFSRREWCYYGAMQSDAEGICWLKRLGCGDYQTVLLNHTAYAIFASPEQHKLHPEYLAYDCAGVPYAGYPIGVGMPRFSDPGFRRASAVLMDKVFDAYPGLEGMALGAPDGGMSMDARDVARYSTGKVKDTPEQRLSRYVWDYCVAMARELKKTHPDKCLIHMVYGRGTEECPTDVSRDVPDNITLCFTNSPENKVSNRYREGRQQMLREWLSFVKPKHKVYVWAYYLYYIGPTHSRFPIFFTESLQHDMQEMQSCCAGNFMEVTPKSMADGTKGSSSWRIGAAPIMNLMMYWQSKLLWNPNLDRKAVLDEYYRLYFGPGIQTSATNS